MGKFLSKLEVNYVDGNVWQVSEPLIYLVNDSDDTITVPVGFMTDFASVPPVIRWLFPKSGKYSPAAVIHDWLYFTKVRPRSEADGIFCEAMKALGVGWFTYQMMYWHLRMYGWIAWKFGKDTRNIGLAQSWK